MSGQHVLRSEDLRNCTEEERNQRIRDFIANRPKQPTGALQEIEQEIASLEEQLSMTSETMRQSIGDGSIRESNAHCHWLMLLHRRDFLLGKNQSVR